VEVIKDAVAALYGGQALGGVINLISKRPDDKAAGELILNATTRAGQDMSAYGAMPLGGNLIRSPRAASSVSRSPTRAWAWMLKR
jgi:outer membrane receptor for ferrienterochelin and colicins